MKKIFTFLMLLITSIGIAKAQNYVVSTYAGSTISNVVNGNLADAKFRSPERLIYDNNNNIIVVDRGNHTIRKINTSTGIVSTIAGGGTNTGGYIDANGTSARFNNPWGAAIDAAGNIYVVERDNYRVRKIAPNGDVTTVAGTGVSGTANNDNPLEATFMQLLDIVIDNGGNLIVADGTAHKIRKIATDGKVTTLAGTGAAGFKDDDNPLLAQFSSPSGLGIDNDGNILVADRTNNRIRKIALDGKVTTIVGSGTKAVIDNDNPLLAQMSEPYDVYVDADGNIYAVELANVVRKIAASGKVTTIAGIAGSTGFANGAGSEAQFSSPAGVSMAANGDIYIADVNNHKIRKIVEQITTPVNLVSFTAKLQGTSGIKVAWQTASEQNNSHFELLKSRNGVNWDLLKMIDGKGNSSQFNNYTYIDTEPFNNANYYLLKQVDYDGKSSFSEVESVNFNIQDNNSFRVSYLNGHIHLSANGIIANGIYALKVSNINGQVISTQNVLLSKGENKFEVQSRLQSGIYVVSLNTGDNLLYTKIVVEDK